VAQQVDLKSRKSRSANLRNKSILATTRSPKLPSLVMTTMSGIQFPVPATFSLRALAEGFPGTVTGMLTLGWLSGDSRVRVVRDHWISIPREMRHSIEPEQLCEAAGLESGQLVELMASAGYDLQLLDSASFMAHIMGMFARVRASPSRNLSSAGQLVRIQSRRRRRLTCAGIGKKKNLGGKRNFRVPAEFLVSERVFGGATCGPLPTLLPILAWTAARRCGGTTPRTTSRA
jgi:hypothetical protein